MGFRVRGLGLRGFQGLGCVGLQGVPVNLKLGWRGAIRDNGI